MSPPRKVAAITATIILALTIPTSTAVQTLIPAGSLWKFNDSGITQAGWTTVAFADAAWPSGIAQLGYGDSDESTTISFGSDAANKRITAYFRRTFSIANPIAFSALTVRYLRDDGAVIYLNGVEVVRSNLPTGTISATTLASVAIANADETLWHEAPIPASLLTAGTNVLAVEIHQNAATSSDLSFDLELRATDGSQGPPSVTLNAPGNQAVANSTTVAFSASATSPVGLSSATLFVGGPPVTAVFTGPSQVQDAQISADTPDVPSGAGLSINVDGQMPHAHGLLKFPTLVGGGTGQIPAGAMVVSATLRLNCTDAGLVMRIYRLTQDWNAGQATWNQRASGLSWGAPGADGLASNAGVAVAGDCTTIGWRNVDLTRFVQEWASGAPNYGVVLTDSGVDGVDFTSSEGATPPALTVIYKSAQSAVTTTSLSGISASATFSATLPLGTSFWNVRVTDIDGQSSFAPADFRLTVDVTAPNPPTLVSPSSGATGVPTNTTLSALVSNPSSGMLTATATLREAAEPEFTIIALPDTQHYSEAFPEIFAAQTRWIVNNKAARNIVFVTHEGDVVEHQGTILEWERANASMSLLDGIVPYGIGPGNHDLPTTNFNLYFPWTRYASQQWYGGHYQNLNDHNFQLFSGGGKDFVIVHLAYCPSAAAVAWADSVYKTYPDRIGILTTHAYLNEAAQRSTHGCTNTQYLWDGLAIPNPNLHFMLSGHVHDEARRTDIANGHPVYQMLADYQDRASGGEGWLRILRFVPADSKVYVQTYSPWLNRYETDANSEFQLDFPMAGPFANIGGVNVPSGGTAPFTPTGLQPATTYEWRVTVTNTSGTSATGPVWRFTTSPTGTPTNTPPTAGAEGYFVQSGTTLNIAAPGVLANDTDAEGTNLTAQLMSSVAHGTLSLASNGGFVYTPASGYTGPDGFAYRASDGHASSATVTVAMTVTAAPSSSPPSPWLTQDVGSVAQAGSASLSTNGAFTVSGSGANIWGTSDGFRYVYQPISGDTQTITAHVPQVVQSTSPYAKVGVMLRESTEADAAHVVLSVRPDGKLEFMKRSSNGGQTTFVGTATQPAPTWLRLSRSGSTVTAEVSASGNPGSWRPVGPNNGTTTVSFSSNVLAGLVVCANSSALNTATFDNVTVSGSASPPPTLSSPWLTQDVGSVAQAGSASLSTNGAFIVSGSGANIWDTSDGFRYVYQPISGDTQTINAHVPQVVQSTSPYAKVGVMLRESTEAGATHVVLSVRPDGKLEFMKRASNGGQTTFVGTATQPAPTWLRLSRSGLTVTAEVSASGSPGSWRPVGPNNGTTTVSFSSNVLAGLVVCANSTALNTATFDNVTTTPWDY